MTLGAYGRPPITVLETVWIPLGDGTRLAARIWLPRETDDSPVPAVLEYLPYRRRDRHRLDDSLTHPYFAAHGYAAVRVDMRGSGDSDGVMSDEYAPSEWADAAEVIAWIAGQQWCTGHVGMMGLSWSGFNSLQVAALRPPALKAIITACASDNRYGDDMHYMGGCLLNDNLQYGATLFTWTATPPDPLIVGERWRDMWIDRLEEIFPPALRWLRHQQLDAYWKSGSVAFDYGAIEVPVLAVGGWSDGYRNAVMRLLSGLRGPRKGLIGPWSHAFPHVAKPGPQIDFLAYATRWWDQWLKGHDTGLMTEPMLTCWMQESEAPHPFYEVRQGRWIAEQRWPSANIGCIRYFCDPAGLQAAEPVASTGPIATVASPADLGTASGEWCPYGWGPDLPLDQRGDDAGSATFDTPPLDRSLQLLGSVRLHVRAVSDAPEALLAIRLNDISPDGVSRRITYGLLNLAHRAGHERALPLVPDEPFDVELTLNDIAYEVPPGHRLRVALSSAYWPLAFGAPTAVRLRIYSGYVDLPIRLGDNPVPPELGTPDVPFYPEAKPIIPPSRGRLTIARDLNAESTRVDVVRSLGSVYFGDVDIELTALGSEVYEVDWGDPGSARSTTERLAGLERHNWNVEVKTRTALAFENAGYRFEASIEAFHDGTKLFEKRWNEFVPRAGAPHKVQPKNEH